MPVIISEDEVLLTIKNPSWLKQFSPEGSKYSSIVEAVGKMYPNGVKKIIVRAPESNDDAIRKEHSSGSDDEAPAPAPTPKPVKQPEVPVKKEEVIQAVEAKEEIEADSGFEDDGGDVVTPRKTSGNGYHSDNVNMVMDLFEGKFIE